MKIFVIFVICIVLCNARAGYRRNAALVPSRNSEIRNDYEVVPDPNNKNNFNVFRHQTNVITGKLTVRVDEVMTYVIQKLQQLKEIFDKYGWTTLSGMTENVINILDQRLDDQIISENESNDENQFVNPSYPAVICGPFDTRPQCKSTGFGH